MPYNDRETAHVANYANFLFFVGIGKLQIRIELGHVPHSGVLGLLEVDSVVQFAVGSAACHGRPPSA
ncbi:MAG: hypothetical protein HRU13_03095 [Phycisphaerales bacterium]|nr:hypothetical protein [Phycisphaerales bacterium]